MTRIIVPDDSRTTIEIVSTGSDKYDPRLQKYVQKSNSTGMWILLSLVCGFGVLCMAAMILGFGGQLLDHTDGNPSTSQKVSVQTGPCLICVNTGDITTSSDSSTHVDSHDAVSQSTQSCAGVFVGGVCVLSAPNNMVTGDTTNPVAYPTSNLGTLPQVDAPASGPNPLLIWLLAIPISIGFIILIIKRKKA